MAGQLHILFVLFKSFFTDVSRVTKFFLLVTITYDCFMAICKPLHYVIIMNNRVCQRLVHCCWISGMLIILPPLTLFLNLKCCDSNVIDYFLCDASSIEDFMLRHMAHCAVDYCLCCAGLHFDPCVLF